MSRETVLRSYTEETREKFGAVIGQITEAKLRRALEISQSKWSPWVTGKLNDSIKRAEGALGAVTRDFSHQAFRSVGAVCSGNLRRRSLGRRSPPAAGGFWSETLV